MGLFLTILLYTFLSLIAVVILLVLILLLFPFRFSASGRTHENMSGAVEISWLSPRVIRVVYDTRLGAAEFRIFGRKLGGSNQNNRGTGGKKATENGETGREVSEGQSRVTEGGESPPANSESVSTDQREDQSAATEIIDDSGSDEILNAPESTDGPSWGENASEPLPSADHRDITASDKDYGGMESSDRRSTPSAEPYKSSSQAAYSVPDTIYDGQKTEHRCDGPKPDEGKKDDGVSLINRWRESEARFFLREKKILGKLIRLAARFLRALFRIIKIDRFDVVIRGGAPDPSITGMAFGYIKAAQGFLAGKDRTYQLTAVPVFGEGMVVQARGEVIIHTSLLRLLYPVLIVLFTFPYLNALMVFLRFRRFRRAKTKRARIRQSRAD